MPNIRFAFMGTSPFSVIVLQKLLDANIVPHIVYSQPPRAKGRGMKLHPSPVAELAQAAKIPLVLPDSLTSAETIQDWHKLKLDAAIVVSYGMKLPQEFLNAPKFGCINIHPSLLPRWRGAAPLERAIEAGDTHGGVTIIKMDTGIDTGPILVQKSCPIPHDSTGGTWHDHTANMGADLLIKTLDQLETIVPKPQPQEGACYARMFSKASLEIDFHQPAYTIRNTIRAFAPKPGAWCWWRKKRLRLFSAKLLPQDTSSDYAAGTIIDQSFTIQTGDGMIQPTLLQLEGRNVMTRTDFLNGQDILSGEALGHKDA